jgi:Icc-related predicted phosphoesterase
MKLWIMSNTNAAPPIPISNSEDNPFHDVLVLAGNCGVTIARSLAYATALTDRPSIVVAGPHEFYDQCIDDALAMEKAFSQYGEDAFAHDLLAALEIHDPKHADIGIGGIKIIETRAQFLEHGSTIIDGVRFLGCTLWTDFLLFGESEYYSATARAQLSNEAFTRIETRDMQMDLKQRFTPLNAHRRHRKAIRFLHDVLSQPWDGPTVVVTHHAPHQAAYDTDWQNNPNSAAYASDLTNLIETHQPDLRIHGCATHCNTHRIGRTRIVTNPVDGDHGFTHSRPALIVHL